MPIFEYRCERCGREFERLHRSDADPIECPGCGSTDLARLLSAPSAPRSGVRQAGPAPGSGCCGGGCGCSH